MSLEEMIALRDGLLKRRDELVQQANGQIAHLSGQIDLASALIEKLQTPADATVIDNTESFSS